MHGRAHAQGAGADSLLSIPFCTALQIHAFCPTPCACSYERSSQFIGRALRMPEGANMDAIRARYDNGVLTLDGEPGRGVAGGKGRRRAWR